MENLGQSSHSGGRATALQPKADAGSHGALAHAPTAHCEPRRRASRPRAPRTSTLATFAPFHFPGIAVKWRRS
eukprot:6422552-Prymnesium_polylepis.1